MANIKIDESQATSGTRNVAVDEVATLDYQQVKLIDGTVGGTDGIPGTLANGLDVDVTRIQAALPPGTNLIGHVVVDSITGSVTIVPSGTQTVTGTVALSAGSAVIGHVIVDSAGSVAVTSLPVGHNIIDSGHLIIDSGSTTAVTALPVGHNIIDSGTITSNGGSTITSSIAMTSGNAVTLSPLTNQSTVMFNTTGTWTGTLTFENTYDGGVTWQAMNVVNQNGSIAFTTITSQTINAIGICMGVTGVRLRCSITGTGTASITITTTPVATTVQFTGALSSIGTSVTPGTAATHLGKAEDAASVSGDTGVAILGIREDTPGADAAYTNANADYTQLSLTKKGEVYTQYAQSIATLSNVASSATSVTLLAANSLRKGFIIWNDSTALLYVKFGATASTTSFTMQIPTTTSVGLNFWQSPPGFCYVGIIDGIWASANGNARVTEMATT